MAAERRRCRQHRDARRHAELLRNGVRVLPRREAEREHVGAQARRHGSAQRGAEARLQQLWLHRRRPDSSVARPRVLLLLAGVAAHYPRTRIDDCRSRQPRVVERSGERELRGAGESRSQCRPVARALAGAEFRRQSVRQHRSQHQQHAPGSRAGRLRPRSELETGWPLYARPEPDGRAGRTVLQCDGAKHRGDRHQCARQRLLHRAPHDDGERVERVPLSALRQQDCHDGSGRQPQHETGVRAHDSRAVP